MNIIILARGLPCKSNITNGIFEYEQAIAMSSIVNKVIYIAFDFSLKSAIKKIGKSKMVYANIIIYNIVLPLRFFSMEVKSKIVLKIFDNIYKEMEKQKIHFDIIHAHFYKNGYYAAKIGKKYNIPYIITEHSSDLISKLDEPDWHSIVSFAYTNAKKIIAVSPFLKRKIKQKYSINNVVYIPNMIDETIFKLNQRKNNIFTFICIGNLTKNKNIDIIVDSFNLILKKENNIHLLIIGIGPEETLIKNKIRGNTNICMLGQVDHDTVPKILSACQCLVSASTIETFGVVLVEALMCGVPVISTKSGGPNHFITSKNGLLIEKLSVEDISSAMWRMYNVYNNYSAYDIRKDAIRKFSSKAVMHQIKQIYDDITQKT